MRRKQTRLATGVSIGVGSEGVRFGGGLVTGQNLGFILNELTRNAALVDDFDQAHPVSRCGHDLETGVEVGSATATGRRDSCASTRRLRPGERGGDYWYGVNNLPVSVARDMGADVVIAVDITDPLMTTEDMREAFSVVGQLTTLMTCATPNSSWAC